MRQPFTKQLAIAEACRCGAGALGIEVKVRDEFRRPEGDGLILFGIGGENRAVYDAYRGAGLPVVFWDKGYMGRGAYYRVSVNEFQPHAYFQAVPRKPDRFLRLAIEPAPFRRRGSTILFDGASQKYLSWQGLGQLEVWGAGVVATLRRHSRRQIVYRPRPTHNPEPHVPGAERGAPELRRELERAHLCVSYGGNIGVDALIAGVPHFALGDSIARPLSETNWRNLDQPHVPTDAERLQWLADLAYCQWTMDEIASGEAWCYLEGRL